MNVEVGRCLLFVYGSLQPGHRPPQSMCAARPDRVRGILYDLGRYPAAVEIGSSEHMIDGYVLNVSEEELAQLDVYEGVDDGLYRRVRTVTASGLHVWAYEYAAALPKGAVGPLHCWPHVHQAEPDG